MAGLASRTVVGGDLVAVSLPAGPSWMEVVHDVWSAGGAILPLDTRTPAAAAADLLRFARPTIVVTDRSGSISARRTSDGVGVDPGVALVMRTSGTAGEPKLVELDRAAVEAAVAASTSALGASSEDGWLCCLPLAHVAGMLVLLRGLLVGAPVTVHPSFEVAHFEPGRAAFVSVVQTMLVRLLDAGADLSGFRKILVGGAPVPPALRERAERAGANVVETYGLTESCGGVVYDGTALPGVDVRLDTDGGIELRGPTLMRGYRFDREATANAFAGEGWLRTGDVGTIDGEGRLRVRGRIDEAINTGGEKVWPREVEAAIGGHAKVAEVLVVGRPDPEWGERVVALVVPHDPADPPTLGELRELAARRIGRHKAPRELEVVDRLPQTSSGKLRRLRGRDAGPE